MKVLKHGKLPEMRQHWYFEVPMVCGYCGTEYQLEEGDPFNVATVRSLSGHSTCTSTCPTCCREVVARRENARMERVYDAASPDEIGFVPRPHTTGGMIPMKDSAAYTTGSTVDAKEVVRVMQREWRRQV